MKICDRCFIKGETKPAVTMVEFKPSAETYHLCLSCSCKNKKWLTGDNGEPDNGNE